MSDLDAAREHEETARLAARDARNRVIAADTEWQRAYQEKLRIEAEERDAKETI